MSKNPGNVSYAQTPKTGTGKTSSKKNPGKVGFTQPDKGKGGTSTKKNPGQVGFEQPKKGGSAAMPKYDGKNVGKGAKVKPAKKVAPPAKFTSTDDLVKYRKAKYGA